MPRMASLPAAVRPSPSRWPRTCSCGRAAAWSARRWNCRWRYGSTSCCPSTRILEIYLNIAELGPNGQFGAQTGSLYAFGHGASHADAARGSAAGGDPAQSAPAQRPYSGAGRAPSSRDLCGSGPGRRNCSAAGAKIGIFEPFSPILKLALRASSSISAASSAFSACASALEPPVSGRCHRSKLRL